MSENLQTRFNEHMYNLYERVREECHYAPRYFHRMLTEHGGIETARRLLNQQAYSGKMQN